MSEGIYILHIEGNGANAAAEALAGLIEKEFGRQPSRIDTPECRLEIAVLTFPGNILNAASLTERFIKKQKIDAIINWAHENQAANPALKIRIVMPSGNIMKLDMASSSQIFDAPLDIPGLLFPECSIPAS